MGSGDRARVRSGSSTGRSATPTSRARLAPADCASSISTSAELIGVNRLWKYSAAAVAVPMDVDPLRTRRNPTTRTAARPMYSPRCRRL
ncbi:hypothetical protein ACFQX6_15540 [Streptosporangium lutulentum]